MERTIERVVFPTIQSQKVLRVAAYARVSSGKDAMLHSLSAQVSEYSKLIQSHSGWYYCGVYADEAMTGTKENRAGFQDLLSECRAGNIDMIITKSISRFARNTVTLLEIVRELKGMGVDVFFQEQNIHTMSADGELMMTILASYAQEESRSASENQKWRVRANFKAGIPWNGAMLGYRMADGAYVPLDDEAALVREIFRLYREEGYGLIRICKHLNEVGIRTRKGYQWSHAALSKLMRNYAYTGNLLLQTTYRNNHIEKKKCDNHGELPMYHAMNTHEAIIPVEEFEATQKEIAKRASKYAPSQNPAQTYPFTMKLQCKCCGKNYRRKIVRGRAIWICTTFNTLGKAYCPRSRQIPEDILMDSTAEAMSTEYFDPDSFQEQIQLIEIAEDNVLTYYFKDGRTVETVWCNRPRSESWTPEMKETAKKKALQQGPKERYSDGRFKKK